MRIRVEPQVRITESDQLSYESMPVTTRCFSSPGLQRQSAHMQGQQVPGQIVCRVSMVGLICFGKEIRRSVDVWFQPALPLPLAFCHYPCCLIQFSEAVSRGPETSPNIRKAHQRTLVFGLGPGFQVSIQMPTRFGREHQGKRR